jgi:hypothetical protein
MSGMGVEPGTEYETSRNFLKFGDELTIRKRGWGGSQNRNQKFKLEVAWKIIPEIRFGTQD